MAFDVFALRDSVVQEYRDYFESFDHILDSRIEAFVRDKLAEGELWPDAVLQLNPAYAPGPTLGELAARGRDGRRDHHRRWVEEAFGLAREGDRLVRRSPLAFEAGLRRLVADTGLAEDLCRERLKAALDAANAAVLPSGEPVFAFRLHQFLASGGSVYATLQAPDVRALSTEGQYFAPAGASEAGERLQFPLAFCRECGHDVYLASKIADDQGERLIPRPPLLNIANEEIEGEVGFFSIECDGLWHKDENLPDAWLEFRQAGPRLKRQYEVHEPVRLWMLAEGRASRSPSDGAVEGWWQPKPLMLCLRCRAAYDLRETSDFRKLVTLSQTGRSTATTLVSTAAVAAMRADPAVDANARKLLSFTDNRQDASLQAGHLSDFVQVVLLRGAVARALQVEDELTFDRIGPAVLAALDLEPRHYMKDAVLSGPGYAEARRAMIDLLDYRVLEDLARAWRVAQPNLERTGLLRIDYHGLAELAHDDGCWAGAPVIGAASARRREEVLRAVLDHLRGVLTIDFGVLTEERTRSLVKRVNASLREPWAFDEYERLRRGTVALLPGATPAHQDQSIALRLGARSAIGRYLRSRRTWELDDNLSAEDGEHLALSIVNALRGHILSVVERDGAPLRRADLHRRASLAHGRWSESGGRSGVSEVAASAPPGFGFAHARCLLSQALSKEQPLDGRPLVRRAYRSGSRGRPAKARRCLQGGSAVGAVLLADDGARRRHQGPLGRPSAQHTAHPGQLREA